MSNTIYSTIGKKLLEKENPNHILETIKPLINKYNMEEIIIEVK